MLGRAGFGSRGEGGLAERDGRTSAVEHCRQGVQCGRVGHTVPVSDRGVPQRLPQRDDSGHLGGGRDDRCAALSDRPRLEPGGSCEEIGTRLEVRRVAEAPDELEAVGSRSIGRPVAPRERATLFVGWMFACDVTIIIQMTVTACNHRGRGAGRVAPVVVVVVVVVVGMVVGAACGGGQSAEESAAVTTSASSNDLPRPTEPPPGVTVVADLGYPRDLLDRGRVNLVVTHASDTTFVAQDRRLRARHFSSADVEIRRTTIPPNGQPVALQTLFGAVDDCTSPDPVAGALEMVYRYGDDPVARRSSFPLDDATVLDRIRAQECAARMIFSDHEITLSEAVVDGEELAVELSIRRRVGRAELVVDAIAGTVLFGVESPYEQGAPERTLAADAESLTLPLRFDVNRCDPHAVAETTKRAGLDLSIGVDGADAQRVSIPVESILDDLEVILARCKARTGQ